MCIGDYMLSSQRYIADLLGMLPSNFSAQDLFQGERRRLVSIMKDFSSSTKRWCTQVEKVNQVELVTERKLKNVYVLLLGCTTLNWWYSILQDACK